MMWFLRRAPADPTIPGRGSVEAIDMSGNGTITVIALLLADIPTLSPAMMGLLVLLLMGLWFALLRRP